VQYRHCSAVQDRHYSTVQKIKYSTDTTVQYNTAASALTRKLCWPVWWWWRGLGGRVRAVAGPRVGELCTLCPVVRRPVLSRAAGRLASGAVLLATGVLQHQVLQTGVLQHQVLQAGVLQHQVLQAEVLQHKVVQAEVLQHQVLQTGVLQHRCWPGVQPWLATYAAGGRRSGRGAPAGLRTSRPCAPGPDSCGSERTGGPGARGGARGSPGSGGAGGPWPCGQTEVLCQAARHGPGPGYLGSRRRAGGLQSGPRRPPGGELECQPRGPRGSWGRYGCTAMLLLGQVSVSKYVPPAHLQPVAVQTVAVLEVGDGRLRESGGCVDLPAVLVEGALEPVGQAALVGGQVVPLRLLVQRGLSKVNCYFAWGGAPLHFGQSKDNPHRLPWHCHWHALACPGMPLGPHT
jgi:hypothetical protein